MNYLLKSSATINRYSMLQLVGLITGGKELLSQEGTTQGDPLSMPFYAVSTHILIMFLRIAFEDVEQVWLADDASATRQTGLTA